MVTTSPLPAEDGFRLVTVGAGVKVAEAALVAVPPFAVTTTAPLAPAPTLAVMEVWLLATIFVAATPPTVTAVAFCRPVPVMVIVVPLPTWVGLKPVTVGGVNVKVPPLVAVPTGVVTLTVPVVPAPTTAEMEVALLTVNDVAAVLPKLTAVAPVKLVPVIVTAPRYPAGVVKPVMVGSALVIKPIVFE